MNIYQRSARVNYLGFSLSSDYHFDNERVRHIIRPMATLWIGIGQATILCPVVVFFFLLFFLA